MNPPTEEMSTRRIGTARLSGLFESVFSYVNSIDCYSNVINQHIDVN
jgi:hypothetical protein